MFWSGPKCQGTVLIRGGKTRQQREGSTGLLETRTASPEDLGAIKAYRDKETQEYRATGTQKTLWKYKDINTCS